MAGLSAVLLMSLGLLLGAGESVSEAGKSETPQAEGDDTDFLCVEDALYYYYSDASHTTWVGETYCACGHLAVLTGRRTSYVEVVYAEPCMGEAQDCASEVE
ncbi:hypothetical protein [Myxococcus sp. SDU36]|uniref:hypothetical protein n=1 Tax=Myxococcus sp. SDU36 TaxID=2831967 RepID=UPI002542CCE8|nr:hypothetical protein [Myxococcus sp. SDU36]WIG98727.1 hypothetical protein KGD87_15790 [Myxococcus sp. SDU36]